MGKLFKAYLSCNRIWACNNCATHLADHEGIVSKQFQGRHGRAYLFEDVVNVALGKQEERRLMTGLHLVADIYCTVCKTVLGWKYLKAYDPKEQYKEDKYLVEKAKMVKDHGWT